MNEARASRERAGVRGLSLLVLLGAATLALTAHPVMAGPQSPLKSTRMLVVPEGRATLLRFNQMKRVEVVDPLVADVVVASLNDLSVHGKKTGETTIYVWDKTGIHQLEITVPGRSGVEQLIGQLKPLLGEKVKLSSAGENALVVEGTLTAAEAERARSVLTAAGGAQVKVVDLIVVEGLPATGAEGVAAGLRQALGDRLQYVVWNKDTLLVQGTLASQAEVDRAKKLITAAAGKGVNIVDLVELNESLGTPPLQEIAQAVGPQYRVWQIKGMTVGVEGVAPSAEALADLNKVLENFAGQAKVVNLVKVETPKPDIKKTVALLQQTVGEAAKVRAEGQTVVIEGVAKNPDQLAALRELIARVPQSFPILDLLHVGTPDRKQIVCHVRVLDISKGGLSRLGVNWGQLSIKDDTVEFVDQPFLIHSLASGLVTGGVTGQQNALSLGAQLEALISNNQARVLSEPNLRVDDTEVASILVGGEIPIPVSQPGGGGAGITVEWKQYGVRLEIQPTILESGNRINLKVTPEVSSLDYTNSVTIGGFVLPGLRSRKASTVLTISDGDTLVLGGLLQSSQTKAVRKIPLLGDIPIIGKLFERKEFQSGESELVILVTPEIAGKPGESAVFQ